MKKNTAKNPVKKTVKAVKRGLPKNGTKKIVSENNKNVDIKEVVIKAKDINDAIKTNKEINDQITDSVTSSKENSSSIYTSVNDAKIEPSNNDDIRTDSVSYNNMIVPQHRDNSTLYLGAIVAGIIILWLFFV